MPSELKVMNPAPHKVLMFYITEMVQNVGVSVGLRQSDQCLLTSWCQHWSHLISWTILTLRHEFVCVCGRRVFLSLSAGRSVTQRASGSNGDRKREFNVSVQATSCKARPVLIGLDYISTGLSPPKINQQYYHGRREKLPWNVNFCCQCSTVNC